MGHAVEWNELWRICLATFVAVSVLGLSKELPADEIAPTPEPLVEMAYAAELAGQPAVRDALVHEVLDRDPDNEKARWLAGHVRDETGWSTASDAEERTKEGKLLQEYIQQRETSGEDAASRLQLANWCRDHGMPDRERLHLTELVASHGPNPALMSRLGMIKFRGQWIPEENLDEFRRLDDGQRRVEKKWRPVFVEWKDDLKADDAHTYEQLTERLATVTDGDAFSIAEEVLSTNDERAALAFVERLDQMPTQAATESLARHAVFSEFEAVRVAAADALKKRPVYNYVPILLAGLVDPMEYEIEYPYGNLGYRRTTAILRGPGHDVKMVSHQAEYQTIYFMRQMKFVNVSRRNPAKPGHYVEQGTERLRWNERVIETLYRITGERYSDVKDWQDWWRNYAEYEEEDKKPVQEGHNYCWDYRFRTVPSCLACGTLVATETGSRPIEQIFPGDKVLAQDPDTGELGYKVVLHRTVRRLGAMRKITIGDGSVTVTLGHPFWVVGKGWQMAKELEIGQRLRALGSSYAISCIEELPEDVAYNLVVDDFATYFAGHCRLLLHDNTLPAPTDAVLPGFVAPVK